MAASRDSLFQKALHDLISSSSAEIPPLLTAALGPSAAADDWVTDLIDAQFLGVTLASTAPKSYSVYFKVNFCSGANGPSRENAYRLHLSCRRGEF